MTLTDVVISARSANAKTGPMPTISRPIELSCPSSCPMLPRALGGNGQCYQNGRGNGTVRKFARDFSVEEAAAKINGGKAKDARYIRDRVGGDIMTAGPLDPDAVPDLDYLASVQAVAELTELTAYGYSHAWAQLSPQDVPAGYVLNASTNTTAELRSAVDAGWPTTIASDDTDEIFDGAVIGGRRVITCPEQTGRAADCASCGLCAKGTDARAVTVRFRIH